MCRGCIFDIKEFSVHDGPGVRLTVFLKGCPLRCQWCHNPESWEVQPQLLCRRKDCIGCGACAAACRHDPCILCGKCILACPVRARFQCGRMVTPEELAEEIREALSLHTSMGGGLTFSGGEPLMQPEFLFAFLRLVQGTHTALETCGYAKEHIFKKGMEAFDLILMDIKLADAFLHRQNTGVSNERILNNLGQLREGNTPFVVRIPLIPEVTDSEENLHGVARLLEGAKALQYVELLPYNRMAGAKYDWMGKAYAPGFDTQRPVRVRQEIFAGYGVECRVRQNYRENRGAGKWQRE